MREHRIGRSLPSFGAAGAWLAAAVLAGCAAVGPDYKRPPSGNAPANAGFVNAGASAGNSQPVRADIATFWRGFSDAELSALVERGLAANGDVRIAQARLQEARALLGVADAQALPSFSLDAGSERAVRPITQQPGASRSARAGTVHDAGFIANWELDLFGRARRGSEAAAAQVAASEAGLHAAHTAVAAEVARNYLELRGAQQRLQVTQASLQNQREALRSTNARFDAGRDTQLDVARARTLVENTEAGVPALHALVERAVFRLATLTAQAPSVLFERTGPTAPLPGLPVTDLAALPLGTLQEWLERRPDIIAAERQLAAATASIGVAKADLFPRVSLSGLLGLNAATLGNLANSESALYSLGVGLSWTPFDFGRLRSRVAASEARALQGLASYELTVATALEETEGAFSGFNRNAQRAMRLELAARSAEEAAQLARTRYDAGVTDFLVVLDAERESRPVGAGADRHGDLAGRGVPGARRRLVRTGAAREQRTLICKQRTPRAGSAVFSAALRLRHRSPSSMLDTVIDARNADLGNGLWVRRVLPFAKRRMVGPFIFFDHAGPVTLPPEAARQADVRPHPHIGLATVSYLLSGAVTHRDSLGVEQAIRPGDVNWMTAGRGIAHSERFDDPRAFAGAGLELLQSWVALPEVMEEAEPAFDHYPERSLPVANEAGVWMRVIAGDSFGLRSPVRTDSPLFYVHVAMQAGSRIGLPSGYPERAVYVVSGSVEFGAVVYPPGKMLVFTAGSEPSLRALEASTVMLLGGEPLGERHIWWNFVSSRKERIEQAKADWQAGRIALPPNDRDEFIPLPA